MMRTKFKSFLTLLLVFMVQLTFAQEKTVTGKVSDKSGPLPGVTVLVKGTKIGTTTDFDGNYTIKAPVNGVLQFSFIGMQTMEKNIGASNILNIVMQENAEALNEVVVMGYGTKMKNELTGSTVQLKSDKIADVPAASVDQALQGRVAGLTISSSSGTPGSVQDIRIRGISSITAGNSPLYVIDGVPVINENVSGSQDSAGNVIASSLTSLSALNSDDIESITVLKDASATSAYGARGANGVIVITTKSGKTGKTTYNFTSSVGFANDAVKGRGVLTAAQTTELGYEALVNSGYFATIADAKANYNWTQDYWGVDGETVKDPNWAGAITNKDALQKNYNLSAQGGDDTSRFYASLGFYKSEATVIGTNFERLNASLSYTKDLSKKLKFDTKISASNSIQNGVLEGSAYFASPRVAKYFLNPLAGSPYNADGSINLDLNSNVFNPLYIMKNDIQRNSLTRIINNNSLQWKATEDLKFKTTFSADYIIRDYKNYQNRVYGDGASTNGYGYGENYQNINWVWQNSVDYRWNISDNHRIDFKALMEYQKNKSKTLGAEGEEYSTDGLTNLDTAGKPIGAYGNTLDWESVSYMGMANYAFSNKIFVDFTYRREGSSKFPEKNRYGNFWSTGVAWNLQEENFMKSIPAINNLKLRGSFGTSGNSSIGLNLYQAFFGYDSNYAGTGSVYPAQFGNNDLTWEKNDLMDVGLDLGLFKDRFTATFSYFNRRTYDLLLNVPLSLTTGHASQYRNVGEMTNKGIEISYNFNIIRSDDLNFSLGGNFATVKNNVTKLAKDGNGDLIEITNGYKKVTEGEAVYSWYMRKYAGVNPDNGNAQWYVNGKDGAVTENYSDAQRAFVGGSALPTLTGGFNMHFDFKGFFVDADAYFATGHKLYEQWSQYTHQGGIYNFGLFQGVSDLMNRWQQPGDITNVPKVLWDYDRDRSSTSTRFLYDGDYIRLKNVTIGYNLSSKTLDKTFLTGVKLYLRGSNLATWVKDGRLKQDPEVAANGYIGLTTPPTKTILFGVNLKF